MWPFGSKKKTRRPRSPACALHADRLVLRGRYDAAVTNAENARHWANADGEADEEDETDRETERATA